MKKLLIALLVVMSFTTAASAQRALGVRIGAGSAYGAEFSYQNYVTDGNRIELDLGVNDLLSSGFSTAFAAVYQFHWTINDGLGWFAGPGAMASLGLYDNSTHFGLGIGGQVGLEYQFAVPFQISIDIRPIYNLIGYVSGLSWGAALGLRYTF